MAKSSDPLVDARKAYDDALERAEIVKAKWVELGQPVLAKGSTKQQVPHPLLKAINEAEVLADRLRKNLMARHAGPKPSAVVGEDLGKSPAARLRAVK